MCCFEASTFLFRVEKEEIIFQRIFTKTGLK